MSIIEMTRELGKALQSDPVYMQFAAAKIANEKDDTLTEQISEFHKTKMALDVEMCKEDKDTEAIKTLNDKLTSLYSSVTENPNMVAFEAAQAQMDELLQRIHFILTSAAKGEDPMTCPDTPPACSGSCATCGGCG